MALIRKLRVGETIREGDFFATGPSDAFRCPATRSVVGLTVDPAPHAGRSVWREVPDHFDIRDGAIGNVVSFGAGVIAATHPEDRHGLADWIHDVADALEQGGEL